MASSSSSAASSNSPCAACKFLRRKCMPGCIFAPYFPPEEPQKFANVHKIFGASNVTKLLNELQPHQREDAVNSLAYEAEARMKDPVYGCVGAISFLQRQVHRLQKELDAANADLLRYACNDFPQQPPAAVPHHHHQRSFPALPMAIPGGQIHPNSRQRSFELGRRSSFGQFHGSTTAAGSGFPFSCPPSWASMNNPSPGDHHMDSGGGGGGDSSDTM